MDATARALQQPLQQRLGQPVVIENKPGAGGAIGIESVANAPADGYTILVSFSSMTSYPFLTSAPKYNALKDFAHLTQAVRSPCLLVANSDFPASNVAELIAHAKARPGALNFGSPGQGTGNHLVGELFKNATGIQMTHVPYKGSAPALQALMAGDIQLLFDPLTGTIPLVKAGKVKALAITTAERSPLLPEIPTVRETVSEFEASFWIGFSVRAGTPADVRQALAGALATVIRAPEYSQQLLAAAAEPVGNTPQEYTRLFETETARWARIIREAGLQPIY